MNSRSLARTGLSGALSALALLAVLASPSPAAFAQGAPPPSDSVKAIARDRYNAGVAAYDAGKYEDARTAFLQAYALTHHPAVLLNLGQSELRSKHEDDAGNHLQQFLREHATATPDQRTAAEKGLAEAKRSTGWVVISVDAPGADLSIDGTTVGKTPLVDPVFLKAGKHTVFAALQGKSAASSIEVKVGQATAASLSLGVAPTPPPVTPQPETPPPTPPPGPPITPPNNPELPPPGPGVGPGPGPGPGPEPVGPPRYTFGEWYKHKPLAWVGTGLAAIGLGMGIAGAGVITSASATGNNDIAAVQAEIASRHDPSDVCNPMVLNSNPALKAHYGGACAQVQSDINNYNSTHDKTVPWEAAGWVFFGLGVVGTATYAVIDWYPNRARGSNTTGASAAPQVAVLPVVSPSLKGLGVVGTF